MFNIQMTATDLNSFIHRHQLTDAKLAEILGITVNAIHHWRAGRRRIPDIYVKVMRSFDKYPGLMAEF